MLPVFPKDGCIGGQEWRIGLHTTVAIKSSIYNIVLSLDHCLLGGPAFWEQRGFLSVTVPTSLSLPPSVSPESGPCSRTEQAASARLLRGDVTVLPAGHWSVLCSHWWAVASAAGHKVHSRLLSFGGDEDMGLGVHWVTGWPCPPCNSQSNVGVVSLGQGLVQVPASI